MRPGRLDQRITFQAVAVSDDGGGGKVETWANFDSVPTVWAHVAPKSGREGVEAGAVNASGSFVFTIRRRDDVTERDRLIWRGEPYNIRFVSRASDREMYLTIHADRGVPQ